MKSDGNPTWLRLAAHYEYYRTRGLSVLPWLGALALFLIVARLFFSTFVTYFLIHAGSDTSLKEINEFLQLHELTFEGFAFSLFVFGSASLFPLVEMRWQDIFPAAGALGPAFKRELVTGWLHGIVIMSGLIGVCLLTGEYEWIGWVLPYEGWVSSMLGLLVRALALVGLAYTTYFFFFVHLGRVLQWSTRGRVWITSLLFTGFYSIVFQLGVKQTFTLFLLSQIGVTHFAQFGRGAGFLAALLVVAQVVFGLRVLGIEADFTALFLIKPVLAASESGSSETFRFFHDWLSGGIAGPLSSASLQFLLILTLWKGKLRSR